MTPRQLHMLLVEALDTLEGLRRLIDDADGFATPRSVAISFAEHGLRACVRLSNLALRATEVAP